MNRSFTFFSLFLLLLCGRNSAQTFSPIQLTGFNWDAVAEANSALANTTGAIDGSNYVMYSVSYATLYSMTTGLPNSGLISTGTRTYQLEPYTGNNMLFTPMGMTDSLAWATPAPYAGLSLLCFSTEGNGSMMVTIRFMDNTTQVIPVASLVDWYGTGNTVLSGFDRVNRTGTTPAGVIGNPKMFWLDLSIDCGNRAKNIKNIKFQNTGTNPRNCIFAISGAVVPSFTAASSPVTCLNGIDGSASVTVSGGIAPFTYNWSTTPPSSNAIITGLGVGVYTVTAQDAGLCPFTTTVAVTQTNVAQPPLLITSTIYTICAGLSVTLTASGATSYTWNTNATSNSISQTPLSTTVYTVGGYTPFNCYRTGSLNLVVNQLPVVTFTTPASICINQPAINLSATPSGGSYAGQGVAANGFNPSLAGVGSKTVSYMYVDGNGCSAKAVSTIVVNALPVVSFTLSTTPLCTNSATFNLSANPSGGVFSGTGVTGTTYSPSTAGFQNATYSYTDANGCSASVISTVMINPPPSVSFLTTKKLYCASNPSLYLNGSPSGGVFNGPGTTAGGAFTPSVAGAGNHNITYSYTDGNGCKGTAVFAATVTAGCVGIAENSPEASLFVVYPNPSNGSFSIKASRDLELSLQNELGQLVMSLKLDAGNAHLVQVNALAEGIYFISSKDDLQVTRQKVIVSK